METHETPLDPPLLYCNRINEHYPLSPEHMLWQVRKPEIHPYPLRLQPAVTSPKDIDLPLQEHDETQSSMLCVQSHSDSQKIANDICLPQQFIKPENGMLAASNQMMNRLTDNDHSVLLKQLTKHASAWREIGTHLGFTQGQLDNIQANAFLLTNSPTSWLSRMLTEWLQWAPGDSRGSTSFATLEGLKTALSGAGFGATACDLGV